MIWNHFESSQIYVNAQVVASRRYEGFEWRALENYVMKEAFLDTV